jgi:uncharacterized protein
LVRERRNTWGCSGGRNQIAIAPDGGIYPCSRFLTLTDPFTSKRGAYRLGSVDEGLSNINVRTELITGFRSTRIACLRCEFADACTGTCLAVNHEQRGSIFDCGGSCCEEQKIHLGLIRRRPEVYTAGIGQPYNEGILDGSHFKPIA